MMDPNKISKYAIGQVVYATPLEAYVTVNEIKHNGFTYMYSFNETDARLGEDYLKYEEPEKGTITWYRCEDQLPPTITKSEFVHHSAQVLITNGISLDKSTFIRTVNETPVGWLGYNIFGFIPTHWAYINYPE